jgi:hypothetical protein
VLGTPEPSVADTGHDEILMCWATAIVATTRPKRVQRGLNLAACAFEHGDRLADGLHPA